MKGHRDTYKKNPALSVSLVWEQLGTRLTAALRAGHYDWEQRGFDPARCWCPGCQRGARALTVLFEPAVRSWTERLLALAFRYGRYRWRVFELACSDPSSARVELDRRAVEELRLLDELGLSLADLVDRVVLRAYTETTGECPFCVTGAHGTERES